MSVLCFSSSKNPINTLTDAKFIHSSKLCFKQHIKNKSIFLQKFLCILHDELLCYLEGELTIHTFFIFLHLLAVHVARVGAIYLMQLTFF